MPPLKLRPLLIFLLITWLALVVLAIHLLMSAEMTRAKHQFQHDAQSLVTDLRLKLNSNEAVLAGLSAFLQAVEQSDTGLTRKYAASVIASYPHIYMIEVARKVSQSERRQFENSLRSNWYPDFAIKDFPRIAKRENREAETATETETWPILFMYPVFPAAQAIYGVSLETVDHLSHTLAFAHANAKPVASPVFNLLEGGGAYILLQEVNRRSTPGSAADKPNFFGDTMAAMLLIKTDALLAGLQSRSGGVEMYYRAVMSVPGNPESVLFERQDRQSGVLDRLLLPVFQLDASIDTPAQPTVIHFSQQLLWADILTLGNLVVFVLLGASLMAAPWLAVRHFQGLDKADREHERAAYLATHDTLTGLPNRFLFVDRFERAYQNWQRNGTAFALVMLDLDWFKEVNDQHGHDVGDEVLKACGARLQQLLRANDTVARYGGDEFMAILSEVASVDAASLIGEKIRAMIATPIETRVGPLQLSCSIGISICPLHGVALDVLRNMADQAMYESKRRGRNSFTVATHQTA